LSRNLIGPCLEANAYIIRRVFLKKRFLPFQAILGSIHSIRRRQSYSRLTQVWAADITYIPMAKGFLYLVAIIDWYSRYVLSWKLSNTLDADFCVEALEEALRKGAPEIFNTDQGSQFTGEEFTGLLKKHGITISKDGKGSYNDNLFIERLWRTVKYEEVYLNAYQDGREARISLGNYFRFYNTERPHQALGYRTPAEVFAPIPTPVSTNERDMVESFVSEPLVNAGPHLNKYGPYSVLRMGSISLYYGLVCNADLIIAGAPQYFYGNYLSENEEHLKILNSIMGDTSDQSIDYLNKLLRNEIHNHNGVKKTKVAIHYSKNEHTYQEHIIHLLKDLRELNYNVEEHIENYPDHGQVAYYFPISCRNRLINS